MPFATRPAQPMYCRLTPAVQDSLLLLARLVQRPHRHRLPAGAPHRPVQARRGCFLTWLIAAVSSHDARFSSR